MAGVAGWMVERGNCLMPLLLVFDLVAEREIGVCLVLWRERGEGGREGERERKEREREREKLGE